MWLEERRRGDSVAALVTAQTRASLRREWQRRVHLCTRVCWRGHLWRAQEEDGACKCWTHAVARACIGRAYGSGAGILWTRARKIRAPLGARKLGRAYLLGACM